MKPTAFKGTDTFDVFTGPYTKTAHRNVFKEHWSTTGYMISYINVSFFFCKILLVGKCCINDTTDF